MPTVKVSDPAAEEAAAVLEAVDEELELDEEHPAKRSIAAAAAAQYVFFIIFTFSPLTEIKKPWCPTVQKDGSR